MPNNLQISNNFSSKNCRLKFIFKRLTWVSNKRHDAALVVNAPLVTRGWTGCKFRFQSFRYDSTGNTTILPVWVTGNQLTVAFNQLITFYILW